MQRLCIPQTPCCRILINNCFYTETSQVNRAFVRKPSRFVLLLLALYYPKSDFICSCCIEMAKCLRAVSLSYHFIALFHWAKILCDAPQSTAKPLGFTGATFPSYPVSPCLCQEYQPTCRITCGVTLVLGRGRFNWSFFYASLYYEI